MSAVRPLGIPEGVVLRGTNIVPGPQHGTGFLAMWQEWDWAWIKGQVDASVVLGANAVRLIGTIPGVVLGSMTKAVYFDRWRQFLDYCAGLGLLVMPCGGSLAYWGGGTLADAASLLGDWGPVLDDYLNVFGVDVTNEAFAAGQVEGLTAAQVIHRVTTLTAALREGCGKALTNSRTCHSPGRWDHQEGAWLDPLNDFHSVHSYYAMAPDAPTAWLSKWWGQKPAILGEFGASADLSTTDRVARYESAGAVVAANPQFVGALAWAATDQSTDPANQWGLTDATGAERGDIAAAFRSLPTSRN